MRAVTSRLLAVTACAALATGFVAGPASASAGHVRNATHVSAGHSSVALPHAGVQPSVLTTNYGAGYFSYPGIGNVSSASATFVMPTTFSCNKTTDDEWLSPGIWVYDSSGHLSQFSGAEFNCNDGVLFTGDVMCVDTYALCDDSITVNPGDLVVASLSESSTSTVATVHDLTTGGHTQISSAATTTDETVFIGDEGPLLASSGAVKFVPTFTKVSYSQTQVNGQYLGDWNPVRYNLKSAAVTQELTSVLSSHGQVFVTRFNHN